MMKSMKFKMTLAISMKIPMKLMIKMILRMILIMRENLLVSYTMQNHVRHILLYQVINMVTFVLDRVMLSFCRCVQLHRVNDFHPFSAWYPLKGHTYLNCVTFQWTTGTKRLPFQVRNAAKVISKSPLQCIFPGSSIQHIILSALETSIYYLLNNVYMKSVCEQLYAF